ncbi:MAG TPA: hypothetical protein VK064_07220 [Wenzhouxiangella sp.]|nr:hypothetical protein [Wenzhouxiangella sp.]
MQRKLAGKQARILFANLQLLVTNDLRPGLFCARFQGILLRQGPYIDDFHDQSAHHSQRKVLCFERKKGSVHYEQKKKGYSWCVIFVETRYRAFSLQSQNITQNRHSTFPLRPAAQNGPGHGLLHPLCFSSDCQCNSVFGLGKASVFVNALACPAAPVFTP